MSTTPKQRAKKNRRGSSPSQSAATAPQPNLAALLREAGPVMKKLREGEARAIEAQSRTAKKLYKQIHGNLKWLRDALAEPLDDAWSQINPPMAARFSMVLLRGVPRAKPKGFSDPDDESEDYGPDGVEEYDGDGERDDVLRHRLARLGRLDRVVTRLRPNAWSQYIDSADDYDLVLGDLIPEDWRRTAHAGLAVSRFEEDSHPTLAKDAAVFEQILEAEEERRKVRPFLGLPTGLPTLDAHTGGLHGLGILGGPSWTGKTTFALAAGAAALKSDAKVGVLFYSLDMDKVRLMKRLVSSESGVPFTRLAAPNKTAAERQSVRQALGHLGEHLYPRMKILGQKRTGQREPLTADAIAKACADLRKSSGAERVLVVIDYLRLMPVPDTLRSEIDRDHYRLDQLHEFQLASRTAAEPEGDVVLVLSEVRKDRSDEGGLTLEDLMGTARLGYSADLVLLMNRIDRRRDKPGTTRLSLEIAKGRDGVEWVSLDLLFRYTVSRFAEADKAPGKKAGDGTKQPRTNGQKADRLAGF